jgi:hypothetical protein
LCRHGLFLLVAAELKLFEPVLQYHELIIRSSDSPADFVLSYQDRVLYLFCQTTITDGAISVGIVSLLSTLTSLFFTDVQGSYADDGVDRELAILQLF